MIKLLLDEVATQAKTSLDESQKDHTKAAKKLEKKLLSLESKVNNYKDLSGQTITKDPELLHRKQSIKTTGKLVKKVRTSQLDILNVKYELEKLLI